MFEDQLKIAEEITPKAAHLVKIYYDALIVEGFTKEEALELAKQYKYTAD